MVLETKPCLFLLCLVFFHFVVVGLEDHFAGITDCCHDILIICTAEELAENNIPATAFVAM